MTKIAHDPRYALWAHLTDGTEGLVPFSGLGWEEQPAEIATRISIDFPDVEWGKGYLSELLALGTPIAVMASDQASDKMEEVARGTIWDINPPDGDQGTFSAVAYDEVQMLHHVEFDAWYPSGLSYGELIRRVCGDWKIPLGRLDASLDTQTAPVQSIQGKTLATAILDWLSEAYLKGVPKLVPRSTLGSLEIVQPGGNDPVYWIRRNESSAGVQRHLSRSNLVTRVVAVGQAQDDRASPVIGILDGETQYGIWQKIVRITSHMTVEEVRSTAQKALVESGRPQDDRSISALDHPKVRKFDKVRVSDGSLDDYVLVQGVSHNADTQEMGLTLGNLVNAPEEGTWTLKDADAIPKLSDAKGKVNAKTIGSSAKVVGGSLAGAINPWIGVPYLFGGTTKAGVDCSGFTQAVYASLGVSLPRTAQQQYNATTRVTDPEVGDLVFFSHTYVTTDTITHCGIYLGGDQMASAIEPRVGRQSLNTAYWKAHFAGYGRIP